MNCSVLNKVISLRSKIGQFSESEKKGKGNLCGGTCLNPENPENIKDV